MSKDITIRITIIIFYVLSLWISIDVLHISYELAWIPACLISFFGTIVMSQFIDS